MAFILLGAIAVMLLLLDGYERMLELLRIAMVWQRTACNVHIRTRLTGAVLADKSPNDFQPSYELTVDEGELMHAMRGVVGSHMR